MKITSLFIGSELLLGQTLNSNLFNLGQQLNAQGYQLHHSETIPDDYQAMVDHIVQAHKNNDVVLVVGGLGPTSDDITRKAVAEALGLELETSETVKKWLREKLANRPTKPQEDYLERQSENIVGAEILWNPTGLAPALKIEKNGKWLFLIPGPPREFNPVIAELVLPHIQKQWPAEILSETRLLFGTKESLVEDTIRPYLNDFPNVLPAYCASMGRVILRLDAHPIHHEELKALTAKSDELFAQEIVREATLEAAVVNLLKEQKLSVATAESCTGGLIGAALTEVSGSSEVFVGSINTYANEWKEKQLGVSAETLETVGAVSEECALAMVEGLCQRYSSNVGIAVTGIAGPGGGTVEKPVGLVYIGISILGQVSIFEHKFRGLRKDVRQQTVTYALNHLRLLLKDR